ncbi:hypothetical protein BKA66DRAFT_514601 [Pyrenochaeta sp. MPI-SDFR-AT-0127]|nr:hypothetical protein BKA66DRAFT_514601 [Pyrenochaeta sp. MPI-SDFR-AT-0127]
MATKLVQIAQQQNSVYLGVWTNWSQGSVAGRTLTVTQQNGGLLIAFIALFVTFTGTCFWMIMSFAIHQTQSQQTHQSAVYHQRQAILRNSDTSAAALWRLTRMLWTWRKHAPNASTRRTLLPLSTSIVTFCAFAVAGIFSSRVATSRGGEVLLIGDKCATLNASLFAHENWGLVQTYITSRVRASANYASTCYANNSSAESCRTFIRNSLPLKVTQNVTCPFPGKDRICRSPEGALRLDSGLLDSHYDLGINSPPSQRFLYRTVNQCAPIQSNGFTRSSSTATLKTIQHLYGEDTKGCKDGCTYENIAQRDYGPNIRNEYSLNAITRYAVPETNYTASINTWKPIPELIRPDADVSLFFLAANDIRFFTPVNDPWFAAGSQGPVNMSISVGDMEVYLSDDPVRVLGCVQQYQFCKPAPKQNASCTPLLGINEALTAGTLIFTQPSDQGRFLWSASAILNMASGFTELARVLKGGALLASDSLSAMWQYDLPNNQWELELEHWFKFTLADVQRAILDLATGPIVADAREFHSPPASAEARSLCNNQKIRSDSYTSFNVLGLILIFAIGGSIMILSALLPWATSHFQRHQNPFPSLEWISNDTLQLQRLAHEAVGAGDWEGACNDYPRTRKGDLLAVLDITNKKHPILKAPSAVDMLSEKEEEKEGEEDTLRDSAQISLLSLEIPRSSLELPQRFTSVIC